jgi:chorismate dehydratase
MTIKVGRMPYLNSDVFYGALPSDAAELIALPPRAMANALREGDLDAGPLPFAEIIRLGDDVVQLGDFCVATTKAAVSILLFTNSPLAELTDARIAVTGHTATSVQLMRVLMAEKWGVSGVELVTPDDPHDALLLIGDPALQARNGLPGFEHKFDLGLEWFDYTGGLPFVFAYWVARRSADDAEISEFERQLNHAFETGIADLDTVVAGRPELGMSVDEKLAYLHGFSYRIGEPERASMERFRTSFMNLPDWSPPLTTEKTLETDATSVGNEAKV